MKSGSFFFILKKLMLNNKIEKKNNKAKKKDVSSIKLFKPVIWVIRSEKTYMKRW